MSFLQVAIKEGSIVWGVVQVRRVDVTAGIQFCRIRAVAQVSKCRFQSHPAVESAILDEALAAAGVVASVRRGAVRLSPHFYITPEEMEVVLGVVAETL